ncbi:hypothetical protein F5876DRAFT_70143 [Lentinula aff. lateritia]|uniref:Uncharacterized protein n=1 Tax=Lentinula aff. lateritia TaxID=2804960 RepID=A0ACC1TK09_9AGAR|nr:hypothetical protein F5876DRAFT_70143 [Lentinula aff. lateritia]
MFANKPSKSHEGHSAVMPAMGAWFSLVVFPPVMGGGSEAPCLSTTHTSLKTLIMTQNQRMELDDKPGPHLASRYHILTKYPAHGIQGNTASGTFSNPGSRPSTTTSSAFPTQNARIIKESNYQASKSSLLDRLATQPTGYRKRHSENLDVKMPDRQDLMTSLRGPEMGFEIGERGSKRKTLEPTPQRKIAETRPTKERAKPMVQSGITQPIWNN